MSIFGRRPTSTLVAGIVLAFLPAVAAPVAARAEMQEARSSQDAKAVAEFEKRLAEYVALHQTLEGTLPALPGNATSQQIDTHQRALERLIGAARRTAKPGVLFSREIRAYFRRQLSRVFSGPEGQRLKQEMLEDHPRNVRFEVNGRYPDSVPLSTIPPQMLRVLPTLPPELEYRFIGETLILLDRHAHIVVDFIDRALPR